MFRLHHLRLHEFRCHAAWERDLSPGVTVFLGKNGKGKTSILEAVYLISRLRSFRTVHLDEMMRWGSEAYRIDAQISLPAIHEESLMSLTWKKGTRILEKNRLTIRDPKEFFGVLPTVLFTPEDQQLVGGGASVRRHWMDHLLGQQHSSYVEVSQRYHRVLKQRNAWLKEENPSEELGKVFQQQFEPLAEEITRYRGLESERILGSLKSAGSDLGFGSLEVGMTYVPKWKGIPDWKSLWERERRLQQTIVGPHRDEWILTLGGKSASDFGSQGQQRLLALALRLIEARHLFETKGAWPILLIDDVTHSLDDERRERFHSFLPPEAQRLMTLPAARPGDLPAGAEVVEVD
ncbi:MAG: DNA replication and repair protein RecF [Verrucomicrobiota bacterium]